MCASGGDTSAEIVGHKVNVVDVVADTMLLYATK